MKIISYSIFGEELIYQRGLKANIAIAKDLFPDWTVRVYCSSLLPKEFIKSLDKENVELIIKKDEYPYHGIMWRILPMQEGHEAVIIRDVDTRLFQRDKNLVDDWLKTSFKYHICRDNEGSIQPILAGLWGARKAELPIQETWDRWVEKHADRNKFLWDQDYLKRNIYPKIRKNSLVYSEHVIYEGEKNIRRIPGERGIFEGRPISLGVYATEDFSKDDDSRSHPIIIEKFGHSYQKNRLQLMDDIRNEVSNELTVLYPRWRHTNIFFNNIIIIFDALLKLMQNDIYNIKPWIKYTILSRIPIFKKRLKKNPPPPFYL